MKLTKKTIYTFVAFSIILISNLLSIDGLSQEGTQVLGIFLGLLILWINVGIDWPSLLGLFLLGLLPSIGFSKILSSSFGSPTFAFLLFTFICTYAFQTTTYPKRLAYAFISQSWAKKNVWTLMVSFLMAVGLLGLIMSPTVLFYIFLPILEEIFTLVGIKKESKEGSIMIIGLIFVATITSGMTPFAHIFPILAMGVLETMANITITYVHYMSITIPLGLVLITCFYLLTRRSLQKVTLTNLSLVKATDMNTVNTRRDSLILTIFLCVVGLWILPTLLKPVLPEISTLVEGYGTAMPPLLGTIVLCIVQIHKKPLLNLNEALSKGVSWPSLIMVATTLALGSVMTMDTIGITTFLQTVIVNHTTNLPISIIVIIFIIWAGIESNISSHMVTAQFVTSIAIPIAMVFLNVDLALLTILIGFLASFGFATPPAMPYVATSIGSKWTTTQDVLKYGLILTSIAITLSSIIMVIWGII